MIKIGIIGGSDPMAGELVRLLINHPDIDIMWINSTRCAGRSVCDVHHGLIGETDLRFSPTADLDKIDVLFIFRHKNQTIEWLNERVIPENLRVIDLSVDMQAPDNAEEHGFVYALPECNRKTLVRGATKAIVPHPLAAVTLLALLPLAKAGILGDAITATATLPRLGDNDKGVTDEEIATEISAALQEVQPGPEANVSFTTLPATHDRATEATVMLDSTVDIGLLSRMFEEYYDDHGFVFVVSNPPAAKEVEGTNKCLIYLDKADGRLKVTAIMDALLKGGAGTALHVMNLLFGLHELTGLALKASNY